MTTASGHVKSGYQGRVDVRAQLISAEFRAMEMLDHANDLRRALIRLRIAARDHLTQQSHESLARLRHELGHGPALKEA